MMNMLAPLRFCGLVVATATVLCGCTETEPPPALGTLERDRIEVTAESAEPIIAIEVRLGDTVERGAVLVRQDPSRLRAQLAQAQALAAQADARLAEARAGPRPQTIAQARARVASARSAADTAKLEFERDSKLVRSSYTSQSQVDIARGRYDEASARLREAQAALDELLAGTRAEALAQAESAAAAAAAHVDEIQLSLDRSTVVAPVAGRVDALPFETGERPTPGSPVATLLGGPRVYARVYVPAALRDALSPGRAARVHLDGNPTAFAARLRWVSQQATFTPFFALTEHDRGRLAYLAEFDLLDDAASTLPVGVPVDLRLD
ncbi:MAG: HlyD family efflux transporter periplasmic adaptor subunit [Burkholderiaceae bacterium]